jgi:hypothetical protein
MKKTQETLVKESSRKQEVLYVAFELSKSKWKLAFSDAKKVRSRYLQHGTVFIRCFSRYSLRAGVTTDSCTFNRQ